MSDLDRFLRDGPYRREPGRLVEVRAFIGEFLNSLEWRSQIYWCERKRIEGALTAHFNLGGVKGYGLCIADCSGPGQLPMIAKGLPPHFDLSPPFYDP